MKKLGLRTRLLRTLTTATRLLPSDISDWTKAMLLEADDVSGTGEFVSWISGTFTTACRMLVSNTFRQPTAARPLELTLSALYLGGFASFVAVRVSFEILTFRIPSLWGHAWISACWCLALALASFSVAIATWFRRSYGRRLAIAYAAVQIVAVIAMDGRTQNALAILLKLSTPTAIIAAMCSPRVKTAFRNRSNDSGPDLPAPLSQSGS